MSLDLIYGIITDCVSSVLTLHIYVILYVTRGQVSCIAMNRKLG